MKQETPSLRRAACLLLAAAALPIAPLAAQETQPPADPPATTAQPAPQPPEVQGPAQVAPSPVPVETSSPPAAESAPAPIASTPRRAPARAVSRAPARAPAAAFRAPAPAPVVVQTTPPAAIVTTTTTPAVPAAPVAASPAAPVDTLPATPSTGTDVVPVDTTQQNRSMPIWPWLLLGLALVAGALLFVRRRRRATYVEDNVYEPTAVAPVAAAPVAAAPVAPAGRPRLDLALKPRRAGVAGADARVEFELTVDNRGNAPAEDVRIATWMLASGASEAERALIEPTERADSPPVTIDAGQSRTMEAAVALATSGVSGDSILPVVVADARYRLPDGREEHVRTSYAVGVPDGEELMHFDTEHPSGLHEGVVAQALGEPERA